MADYRDLLAAVGEPLLTMASGTLAEPISGLYGLAKGDPDAVERVHEQLTYQPQTTAGQVGLEAIGQAAGAVGHGLESAPVIGPAIRGYQQLTESVGENHPLAGALMTAAPTAALLMAAPEARAAVSELPGAVSDAAVRMMTERPAAGSMAAQSGAFRPGAVVPAIKTAVSDLSQATKGGRAAVGAIASRQAAALREGAGELRAARVAHTAETVHKAHQGLEQAEQEKKRQAYRDLLE